jgi:hypothetical protein
MDPTRSTAIAAALLAAALFVVARPAGARPSGRAAHAPDLVAGRVDLGGLAGDWQRLTVSGTVVAEVRNDGDLDVADAFRVLLFENRGTDRTFDPAVDPVLAAVEVDGLARLSGIQLRFPVSTAVPFRDSPIWSVVQAGAHIGELTDLNNVSRSGLDCRAPGAAAAPWPDLTVSRILLAPTADPATFRLTARIGNGGADPAAAGAALRFELGDTTLATATSRSLAPGDFEDVGVTWPAPARYRGEVVVRLDTAPPERPDCDPRNDRFARPLALPLPDPSAWRQLFLPLVWALPSGPR